MLTAAVAAKTTIPRKTIRYNHCNKYSIMENKNTSSLGTEIKAYARVQYKIINLEAVDKLSSAGSWLFSQTVLGIFLLSALLFLSTGGAFYLASLSGSIILGFCIMAGIFVVLFLLFYFFRQRALRNPMKNRIIQTLLEEEL